MAAGIDNAASIQPLRLDPKSRAWGAMNRHHWSKRIHAPRSSEDRIKRPRRDLLRQNILFKELSKAVIRAITKFQNKQQNINHFALIPSLVLGGLWTVIIFLKA